MHLNAKRVAFTGLLLAFTVVLIILSSIIETNTLFLLAAASFCVGISIREYGLRIGSGFFIAGLILGFLLSPNKLYCITYGGMSLYILLTECVWNKLFMVKQYKHPQMVFWIFKYIIFNILFIIILYLYPALIFSGKIDRKLWMFFFVGGQIVLFLYDKGYVYFQTFVWAKMRKKLNL